MYFEDKELHISLEKDLFLINDAANPLVKTGHRFALFDAKTFYGYWRSLLNEFYILQLELGAQ